MHKLEQPKAVSGYGGYTVEIHCSCGFTERCFSENAYEEAQIQGIEHIFGASEKTFEDRLLRAEGIVSVLLKKFV